MISVKDKLPEIGEKTKCCVNFWRYGMVHHAEELVAEYMGMNEAINKPMWDIETYDEAYTEVTHWEPLAISS